MQVFKIIMFIILSLSLKAVGKEKPELLTFKSKKGGYEFSYPSCLKIEALHADELDSKLADVNEIAILKDPKCPEPLFFGGNKSGMSVMRGNLKMESISSEIDSIEKWARKSKREIGTNFIAVSRPKEKSNFSVLTIQEYGFLRFHFYIVCKKKSFIFEIMTEDNFKIPPNLVKEINSSDYSQVKTELKIIESFKCLD